MKEKVFLSEWGRGVREAGGFWHKISDAPVTQMGGARFTFKKPFDGIAILPKLILFCEAKIARPSIILEKHQFEALHKIHEVAQTKRVVAAIIAYGERGKAWIIPIRNYPKRIRLHRKQFANVGVLITKRKGVWDLRNLQSGS